MSGKIIKGDLVDAASFHDKTGVAPRRGNVVNAEEYEAHSTAKQIVLDAHKKAEEIKAEALRFREEVFSKAKEEAKIEIQTRAAEELTRAKIQAGQILAATDRDILELALKVAAKIIGRDLEREPDTLLEIVATAIEATRVSKAIILRVNPEDAKLLREKRPRLMELIGRAIDLSVRDDPEVERGGCVIQTDFGVIDGQLRTQFEMLRNVLAPPEAKKEMK